jgi:hypothetical protein
MGRELMQGSGNVTLTDNTVSSTSAGVVGSANAPTQLNYSVMRDLEQRSGSMKISSIGTSVVFEDSFVETADLGVTLTPTISANVISLMYTTTSTGTNASLRLASRTLL